MGLIHAVSSILDISDTAMLILILLDEISSIQGLYLVLLIAIYSNQIYYNLIITDCFYHFTEIDPSFCGLVVVFHPFLRLLVIALGADQYVVFGDRTQVFLPAGESSVIAGSLSSSS